VTPPLGMLDGQLWDIFGEGPDGLSWASVRLGMERELRWRGQTSTPWPIAGHCIVVAAVLGRMDAAPIVRLAGLVHDVEEAILGDIPTPLKRSLRVTMPDGSTVEYEELERIVRRRAVAALALPVEVLEHVEGAAVKTADRVALHAEARVLCHHRMPGWLGPAPDERLVEIAVEGLRGMLRSELGRVGGVSKGWEQRVRALERAA